ncbi:TPA: hypothetical protein EYP27_05170, partial [Candidatus Bathyarchaeota archaeon]|nr:hypothetical protein [Candidatus Bathyarchaeota archaeon]
MAIIAVGAGAVGYQKTRKAPPATPSPLAQPTVPHPKTSSLTPSASTTTLVYGSWEEGSTIIRAVNDDGTNNVAVAILPSGIKDIHILSKDKLLYISETNQHDHGKKIVIYNLTNETTQTLAQAEPGWGIDDVILSPDKTWIAWWEVRFAPNSKILLNGQSRVYTQKIGGLAQKNLIVDEVATETEPIHYPLFFDHQNRLYLDSFIPNGGGWNLGLWQVNADGSNLTKMEEMAEGMFSADPKVSPDGRKIIFTAYDPGAPLQLVATSSGIRRPHIANPNLIQVMDLQTRVKTTILDSSGGSQYAQPRFSQEGTKIVFHKFQVLGPTNSEYQGVFSYNLSTGKINLLQKPEKTTYEILGFSTNGASLLLGGCSETDEVGNLGENYRPHLKEVKKVYLESLTSDKLLSGVLFQFIALLPKSPSSPLAISLAPSAAKLQERESTIKLKAFGMKLLAALRAAQQNDGALRCRERMRLVRELKQAGFLKE